MDHPFWSDDFDMDLPKVFPQARDLFAGIDAVELWTTGTPDRQRGNLNHPDVWNSDHTMLSFFSFGRGPCRPAFYSGHDSEVSCTLWGALRDAWPHGYLLQIMQQPVWDTFQLRPQFDTLMYDLRGWGKGTAVERSAADVAHARRVVLQSLALAAGRARILVQCFEPTIQARADDAR